MVGLVQGGSQAFGRSLFGNMVPKARTGSSASTTRKLEVRGAGRPADVCGGRQLFGSSRLSIVSLIVFFIVGGLILSRVNEEEGMALARSVDARTVKE